MSMFAVRSTASIVVVAASVGSAVAAQDLTLPIAAPEAEMVEASYICGDGPEFGVRYVNADPNYFAVLSVDGGEPRVFVAVLAASGVRYVSGPYQWWSKGDGATLSDLRDESAEKTCTETSRG